jgi:hypothetical protein
LLNNALPHLGFVAEPVFARFASGVGEMPDGLAGRTKPQLRVMGESASGAAQSMMLLNQ